MTPTVLLNALLKTAAARRKRNLVTSDATLDKLAKQHTLKATEANKDSK